MLKTIALVVAGALMAPAQAPAIPKDFLLYEKQARQDDEHWILGLDGAEDVWNIQCSPVMLSGWKESREVSYDTKIGGGERTDRRRGEQLFVFASAKGAGKMMDRMRALLRQCGKTVKVGKPRIGDEALQAARTIRPTKKAPIPQTQKFVAVREGSAVAIYWDMHNDAKPLRTLARHRADAAKMAAKMARYWSR
ncbi:hypothetical protein AB0K05_15890 [Nonomuraea sp. NPDC049486]|uniref:Uncharacterized protein n=1 Tax=Nonomuraea harbinensis TaxID=1286938 RepID=A0ABW1BJX0_9ACTN|nr:MULTISPECIES: hypothetical protein [Nonomuraea]TXK34180.1 hypothetical protein FR742_32815 [Nonomuraea sp. C10]